MSNGTGNDRIEGSRWSGAPLRIDIESRPDRECLKLGWRVGRLHSPDLEEAIQKLETAEPPLLIIDVNDLDFIDVKGLHITLEAHNRARNTNRHLVLLRPRPMVQRVLQITGMDRVFELPGVWPGHKPQPPHGGQ